MDEKFWANLDATRRAIERAMPAIDLTQLALASDAVQRYAETFDLEKVSATLAPYERLSTNSALVGEAITSVLARTSALDDLTQLIYTNMEIPPPVGIDLKLPGFLLASMHLKEISRLNDAVSSACGAIHFDNLAAFDRSLGRRLVGLSEAYRHIFTELSRIDFVVPDFVTELPARDMLVKSTIVSSRATDFDPSDTTIDLEDPAYERSDVVLMLADLDPGFVTMLDEAVEVVFGTSTGRVRHASVSLRELSMHVLHRLAPDDEVLGWTQDPSKFHNGRPTRQARVLYICRHVNCGPYGKYVHKSVGATLAFFDALNGLHDVRPDVCDFQLRLMLTDAIGILRFLLRTARHRS